MKKLVLLGVLLASPAYAWECFGYQAVIYPKDLHRRVVVKSHEYFSYDQCKDDLENLTERPDGSYRPNVKVIADCSVIACFEICSETNSVGQ